MVNGDVAEALMYIWVSSGVADKARTNDDVEQLSCVQQKQQRAEARERSPAAL